MSRSVPRLAVLTLTLALGSPVEAAAQAPTRIPPAVGHVMIVSGGGGDASASVLTGVGSTLAGLGASTLLGEGVELLWAIATLRLCLDGGLCIGGPPEELTWTALGALGGGLLVAAIGLVVRTAAPRGEPERRPIAGDGAVLRF